MPVELPCMCASIRRASRALTQMYDDALRPLGLHATQFSILQALELAGEVSQSQLSTLLFIDSTTLTRNLRILRKKGWIAVRAGVDRRERWLQLAPLGGRELQEAHVLQEEQAATSVPGGRHRRGPRSNLSCAGSEDSWSTSCCR